MQAVTYVDELGNPDRVFFSSASRLKNVLSWISSIIGVGFVLLGCLFVMTYTFPHPSAAARIEATRTAGYILSGIMLGIGLLALAGPFTRWRRGRNGLALYRDKVVAFDAIRWNVFRWEDIANVHLVAPGVRLSLNDGRLISWSLHRTDANALHDIVSDAISQRSDRLVDQLTTTDSDTSRLRATATHRPVLSREEILARQQEMGIRLAPLLLGIIMLCSMVYLHQLFGEFDRGERDSARVWIVLAMLYNVLGPQLALITTGTLGVGLTLYGAIIAICPRRKKTGLPLDPLESVYEERVARWSSRDTTDHRCGNTLAQEHDPVRDRSR